MVKQSPAKKNTPVTSSAQKQAVASRIASVVVAFVVQCNTCCKRRKESEEHFEDFRSKHTNDPFICTKLPKTTCEKPPDINYNEPPEVWVMDKPDLPKTPNGFKRVVTLRGDCSLSEVKFIPPQGKMIRTKPKMVEFFQEHPEYSHLSLSDFPFATPKIVRETIPKNLVKNSVTSTSTKKKKNQRKLK